MYHTSLFILMAGLLALLNLPARAQDPGPPKPPGGQDTLPPAKEERFPDKPRSPQGPEQKPVSFIGVLTRDVTPELRAQFLLSPGFGLMVEEVMPNSPAQAAGLKVHDILVKLGDQQLVNMEQLMTLVRSHPKDDTIVFTVITGGKEAQVSVKVAERLMPVQQDHFFDKNNPFPRGSIGPIGPIGQETIERFRGAREAQQRFEDAVRNGGRHFFQDRNNGPDNRSGDRRPGDRDADRGPRNHRDSDQPRNDRRDTHSNASVTRSDESGIYSLRRQDDSNVFTAKPKDGQEQSWPVDTEEQRKALPEHFTTKLQELEQIRSGMNAPEDSKGNPPQEQGKGEPNKPAPGPKGDAPPPKAGGPL